jgi:hypothetical protein
MKKARGFALFLLCGQIFPAFGKIEKQHGVIGESAGCSPGCQPGWKDQKSKDEEQYAESDTKDRCERKIFFDKSVTDAYDRKETVPGSKDTEKETADDI